jgi:hypothetical protein
MAKKRVVSARKPTVRRAALELETIPTESLTSEFQVILEDFKAKAASADGQIALAQQVFTLTITAVGLLLAASPFIVEYDAYIIYAVSSFVFYGLALTQLRHALAVAAITRYVSSSLRPRLTAIINALPRPEAEPAPDILAWDSSEALTAYAGRWWQLPVEAARYLIPLVAGVSTLVAYILGQPLPLAVGPLVVIGLNCAALIYIIALSLSFRRGLVVFLQGRRIQTPDVRGAA